MRNNFKESLDEIGAKIVEHVQSKGSQEQLLIHLDYLTSFFEKVSVVASKGYFVSWG
jgi:hypothetical protein